MNTNRVNEMVNKMKSFGKEKYQKDELLTEMFALQREIVELTFNEDHASTADLKIWDVERHLEQLNQDCGNVADKELARFKEGSKTLCNLIKAEVSGNRGEAKAFRTLQFIKSRNLILKNVELSDGERRTELDAVVITPTGITIVEVKNTAKDIFIDENGDYFRTGQFLRWDCNIAQKISLKEELLRQALTGEGVHNTPIKSIVVFTNNRIEVQNKHSGIETCFVSQLAHLIDDYKADEIIADDEMARIGEIIRDAENKEAYQFDFDVVQYKKDFATLMMVLEDASARTEEETERKVIADTNESAWRRVKRFISSRYAGYAGSAAAAAAITLISTAAVVGVRK